MTISTEDGRLLFYSTAKSNSQEEVEGSVEKTTSSSPDAILLAQLGGKSLGVVSRIKDFEILRLSTKKDHPSKTLAITGCSDGSIRMWLLDEQELFDKPVHVSHASESKSTTNGHGNGTNGTHGSAVEQIGKLIGTYETGHRITCLKAFVSLQPVDPVEPEEEPDPEENFEGFSGSDGPVNDKGDKE